jgi:hypothetical protein
MWWVCSNDARNDSSFEDQETGIFFVFPNDSASLVVAGVADGVFIPERETLLQDVVGLGMNGIFRYSLGAVSKNPVHIGI